MTTTAQTLEQPERKKQATIEFWRFAFTVLVVIYHLEVNYQQRGLLVSGVSAVEFFFMLSGFLMAKSAYSRSQRDTGPVSVRTAHQLALDFVKKKLIAIYPILIIVMVFWAIGVITSPDAPVTSWGSSGGFGTGFGNSFGGGFGDSFGGGFGFGAPQAQPSSPFMAKLTAVLGTEYVMLLLVGTPPGFFSMTQAIPMWFLTALLIIGYLYTFAINKRYDIMAFLAPALGLMCWIFFTLTSNTFTGGILDSSSKAGFLNTGMVKAISEMSFGVCIFMLYNYLSQRNLTRFWRVILSLAELYAIARFCMLTFGQPISDNNYIRLFYLMVIILCSFLNITWFSRLLNREIFRKLGGLSLAMYISHYYLKDFYVEHFMKSAPSGFGGTLSGSMHVKDAILYPLVVIAASALIMLYIWFVKRFIITAIKKRQQLKKEALAQAAEASGGKLFREKV